jgi:hypothetical protein
MFAAKAPAAQAVMLECVKSVSIGHVDHDHLTDESSCAECRANLDKGDDHAADCLTVRARQFLAASPASTPEAAPTDAQIIAALHANGIDTYPSKYGFDAVQVSATSVPSLRNVFANLAAPTAGAATTSEDARDAEQLESAVTLFKRLKRDLMSARRFQADTLDTYRRACTSAETDVEEWLGQYRAAMRATQHEGGKND